MTESGWLAGDDPGVLLGWARGRASERKLRLFACACCRALGGHLTGEAGRRAVEVAEAFADGKAAAWELERARRRSTSPVSAAAALPDAGRAAEEASREALARLAGVRAAGKAEVESKVWQEAESAVWWARASGAGAAAVRAVRRHALRRARREVAEEMRRAEGRARAEGERWQCEMLRDLLGNPFRRATFDPGRLCDGGRAVGLARAIYEEGCFADLPVLADALEDAGCADAQVLGHCRAGGSTCAAAGRWTWCSTGGERRRSKGEPGEEV
jgi:hypothetical protein